MSQNTSAAITSHGHNARRAVEPAPDIWRIAEIVWGESFDFLEEVFGFSAVGAGACGPLTATAALGVGTCMTGAGAETSAGVATAGAA